MLQQRSVMMIMTALGFYKELRTLRSRKRGISQQTQVWELVPTPLLLLRLRIIYLLLK